MLSGMFRVFVALAGVGAPLTCAMAQDAGFYTKEQAARGAALFTANCAQCHGANLQGVEAPALKGRDVMGNWVTAKGIYDYASVAMPPSSPGQLGPSVYVDIISHILSTNGAPAGAKPLTLEDLPNVNLVKATTVAGAPAATPAQQPATAATAPRLPQAFTAGRQLPTVGATTTAQPAQIPGPPAAPRLPQAFTAGKQLPVAPPSTAPLPIPGPGQ